MTKQPTEMAMRKPRWRATECVTPGHPDKICDQIADGILDEALAQDPHSRVAMEVHGKSWVITINGEMTTRAQLDLPGIARRILGEIGYGDTFGVNVNISQQSPNIKDMVDLKGAGDQGVMIGYATNETPEFMPLPWVLARNLCDRLVAVRVQGILPWLCPDGKSQVVIKNGKTHQVTIAAHYTQGTPLNTVRKDILKYVVFPTFPKGFDLNLERGIIVNGNGEFCIGGFTADAGTTGRKIVVDQYGPEVPVGGGAFSGKDPTKVDRAAAYMARFVAKSIVASGFANRALITVAYAIGQEYPFCVGLQTDLADEQEEIRLEQKIQQSFDFRPAAIIERLGLRNPNNGWRYQDAAAFGHYGNNKFPWEQAVVF